MNLKQELDNRKMTVWKFSVLSGIPADTLYRHIKEENKPNKITQARIKTALFVYDYVVNQFANLFIK